MTVEIIELAIEDVVANPNNPRKKLTGIDELAASIKAVGLTSPIVVRPAVKGKHVLIAGHRRLAAMAKLKTLTIPAIVQSGEQLSREALVALSENTSREDLTADDLAAAVGQLTGLSMTDEEIVASLSIHEADLERVKTIAGATKATKKKAQDAARSLDRQLTLAEQAALIKYADYDEDLDTVRWTIDEDPNQLDHVIARIESDRRRIAQKKELTDALGATPIIQADRFYGPGATTEPLCNLASAEGKKLSLANHKTCPGHVASLENFDAYSSAQPSVVFFCTDWKANGHQMIAKPVMTWARRGKKGSSYSSSKTKPVTEKEKAKASEERRAVIANNKAWTPATEVRRAWIDDFTKRKTLNAAAKLWVLKEIVSDPSAISHRQGMYRPVDDAKLTVETAFVEVLKQLIAYRERQFETVTWRPPAHSLSLYRDYLLFLGDQGYTLSAVEKLV